MMSKPYVIRIVIKPSKMSIFRMLRINFYQICHFNILETRCFSKLLHIERGNDFFFN